MKSYYSIALFTLFAFVMAVSGVVSAATHRLDITPADAAVVALSIIAAMLTYRLSQAEKRIAHLEDRLENSDDRRRAERRKGSDRPKDKDDGKPPDGQ